MRWLFPTATALTLCLTGCSDDRLSTYAVSGKVVFSDGEPVRSGTIELESLDHGTTASGRIQEDGSFVLGTYTPDDGAVAGRHRAIVVQVRIDDGTVKHVKDHGRAVDPKFGDYHTSDLRVRVEDSSPNDLTIELAM